MQGEKREKTFTVSLKGLAPFVSAIRYEKSQKDVKLFITLAKETRPAVIVEDMALGGKLSEKMFANLEYHETSSLYLSLLLAQDFEECNADSKTLKNCLEDIKNSLFDSSFLLLAEEPKTNTKKGFLWTPKQELKEKVMQSFPVQTKGNWTLLSIGEGTIQEAKERVLRVFASL